MTGKILAAFTAAFLLILSACARDIKPLEVNRGFYGALWVVRDSIATPSKVRDLVDIIEDSEITQVFVQVRGRGDAYYSSDIEPSGKGVKKGFDPLAYLIEKTSSLNVRIHAWVNVSYVLDIEDYPPTEGHVVARYPKWITYDHEGRPITEYTRKEMQDNLVEGIFLDPGLPEVREYTASVVRDIVTRYRVDGVHLDFIRYPYSGYNAYYKKDLSDFGYNPGAVKLFINRYGYDPTSRRRGGDKSEMENFDEFRRENVTDMVRRIRSAVKSVDPELVLSAAVMPRYSAGRKVYFQDWPAWLDEGIIDMACVMSYTGSMAEYEEFIEAARSTGRSRRIIMGVRVKEATELKTVIRQISAAYSAGMRGYIIFSFEHDENMLENIVELIKYRRDVYKY